MSAILNERIKMTDLEEMRKRYAPSPEQCMCGRWHPTDALSACDRCGFIWTSDPSVLALCDEVEALRAKVAAAPEVLREWPKTAEDAPGEWFYCIHGDFAPRGKFEQREGYTIPVFFEECLGRVWVFGEMKPGEFFVRVP